MTPALESARETLAAGVTARRSELEARRAELVAAAEKSSRKARKSAKKARKTAGKKRRQFEKKALGTATSQARGGQERAPRRWPWLVVVTRRRAGVVVAAAPQEARTGPPRRPVTVPVPTYREDPVPTHSRQDRLDRRGRAGDAHPARHRSGRRPRSWPRVTADDSGDAGQGRRAPAATRPEPPPVRTTPPLQLQRGRRRLGSTVQIMSETAAPAPSSEARSSRPAASSSASRFATARRPSSASPSGSRRGSRTAPSTPR